MKRFILAVGFAVINMATPALATDIIDMNPSERDVFRSEIRDYLLENPEVLMEAIAVLEERRVAEDALNEASLVTDNYEAIYNDGASYVGGNPDGDITIVEFSDYRCPYCQKAHPEVEELVKSDGNIRLIYKEFPILGPDSQTTAKFALATLLLEGPKTYTIVSNALMNMRGAPSEAALTTLAEAMNLNASALLEKMESDEVVEIISNNRELGSKLQISGTPTFILAGQLLRGYVPLEDMRMIVEDERQQ